MRIIAQAPDQPAGNAQIIKQTVQNSPELQYPYEIFSPKCMNEYLLFNPLEHPIIVSYFGPSPKILQLVTCD